LPHTARAALTGLRHRGYEVRLERGEKAPSRRVLELAGASSGNMRLSDQAARSMI
jgi:hypothetical protein